MSERACSLHILCVSDSRYTSPPDAAQSAKETDTMLTEVGPIVADCKNVFVCRWDVIIAELAYHVGVTNVVITLLNKKPTLTLSHKLQ